MMTLTEIAHKLSKAFINARDKKHAATNIVLEINSLRYAESKAPIDDEVKQALIVIIENELQAEAACYLRFQKLKPFISRKINVSYTRGQRNKVLMYWLKRKIRRAYKLTFKAAVTIIGMKSSNVF